MHMIPEALGILDDNDMLQIAALRKNCQEGLYADYITTHAVCSEISNYIKDVSGDSFPYDARIFADDWSIH